MKRILFTAYTSPLVHYAGAPYRMMEILKWLLNRFSVDVIFEGSPQDLNRSYIPLERFNHIEVVPPNRSILRKILCVVGKLPYHHVLFCHPAMKNRIRALVQQNSYDLILLTKSVHFPALQGIEALPPVVVDQLAAEPHVWQNLVDNDPRWYARWFFKWNRHKVLQYERWLYKRAAAICITKADQAVTEQYYPGTKTVVVPSGIDPVYFAPDEQAEPDLDLLLFSGTGAVRNLQAIKNLIREVMPTLHQLRPNMRLLWIGNVDRAKHPFLDLPWIETTGFVEHTPPYFNRGMIFVAPFDMGEGMKTKVIEALAMGKVIVSTPTGVHGIDVKGLPFVKVCSDYRAFAEAIVAFRESPNLLELGKLARDHALAHYAWDKVLMPLGPFLDECMRA